MKSNEDMVTEAIEKYDVAANDGTVEPQKSDENAESSSSGSDGGKGGGSGGGYSADCSSSDASSDDAAKGVLPEKQLQRLTLSSEQTGGESIPPKDSESHGSKKVETSGKRSKKKTEKKGLHSQHVDESKDIQTEMDLGGSALLPQWNGIRIHHPMDPRIDLSTVSRIRSSTLAVFPTDVDVPAKNRIGEKRNLRAGIGHQNPPSVDQYMTLMEVVRPFFHAHGISHNNDETKAEIDQTSEQQDTDMAKPPLEGEVEEEEGTMESKSAHGAKVSAVPTPNENGGLYQSDSSSMVVLARVKRKHSKHKGNGGAVFEGSNESTNGSNESSASSSDKRVRIQHPIEMYGKNEHGEESPTIEQGNNSNDPGDDEATDQNDRQESTSATSSEDRGDAGLPQAAPLAFGVPAVVSEYSSSRTGSSGASNSNLLSTSGSGSAGNTGSGTASGSNQGGSSGSGNDQGGISSNGNGSSASGHDVKGSSEETMDNSGENNSGENSGANSDGTNFKHKHRAKASTIAGPPNPPAVSMPHRYQSHNTEQGSNSPLHDKSPSHEESDAAREKKLLDKKRKRMNMRREYEEKVQQDMESSESSHVREENAFVRPGRPVTLDKVLSFTKTPRIIVKADPPFLVVHSNAAYCRLSGIDAHHIVGKPISTLLMLPDAGRVMDVIPTQEGETLRDGNRGKVEIQTGNGDSMQIEGHHSRNEAQGLSAAEAAGRAKAAASQECSVDRLIASNGFGKWNTINVLVRPLVGRDFTMGKQQGTRGVNREEGSNGSSITSGYEGPQHHITCSIGVSPVVSTPEAFVLPEKDQESHGHKAKRRKHHQSDVPVGPANPHQQTRRNFPSHHRKRHLITHYVLQMERIDGTSRKSGSAESHSLTSNTGESQVLSHAKAGSRLQSAILAPSPGQTENNDSEEDVTESQSSSQEGITAIG